MRCAGDVVPSPDDEYKVFDGRKLNRRSHHTQPALRFVWKASHRAAIKRLRAAGLFPIRVPAGNGPHKNDWDNFANVLYVYWIHYCAAEGLTLANPLSRKVLLYLFYGRYRVKGETVQRDRFYDVIRAIHLQVTNGRRRFASFAQACFGELLKLLESEPELAKFLEDGGKGNAPARLLVAVENGLRCMGVTSPHTMGGNSMESPDKWAAVEPWRKREGYTASVRLYRQKGNLKKWMNFLWDDFTHRCACQRTFEARHLPLSDGLYHAEFDNLLATPKHWLNPAASKAKS